MSLFNVMVSLPPVCFVDEANEGLCKLCCIDPGLAGFDFVKIYFVLLITRVLWDSSVGFYVNPRVSPVDGPVFASVSELWP